MTWLIAFLVSHALEIAAVGGAFAAISSVESVVINSHVIYDQTKEEKK